MNLSDINFKDLSLQELTSPQLSLQLDASDPLSHLRSKFEFPSKDSKDSIYLCGNSLGLLPKVTRTLLTQELDVWSSKGVAGHFDHPYSRPWVSIDDHVIQESAKIVGALEPEVSVLNSLTANLHFLMVSFYRPTSKKYKIIMEHKAFPSDYFALESQVKFHGFNPEEAIIQVKPREGEYTLRNDDIIQIIQENSEKTALVLFSGVQYYTGQFFDLERIASNIIVGFDLAHAVGNVPLRLHDCEVDFAVWCTYKYLNAGPGGIGGAFVHSKHFNDPSLPRFHGWWGTNPKTKFQMDNCFDPIQGANVYRVSNPNVLATVSLLGSLAVFSSTNVQERRKKSLKLTGYLEALLLTLPHFKIITPKDPSERGCQLSLLFEPGYMIPVFEKLSANGVIVDERKPDVIRVAPTPLYNSYRDVYEFYLQLKSALETINPN